ncbi:hypothetical protein C1646_750800 [Rhizophagus diaphanus]|nr:hypothetical protein C1646_750800 [Rhizophagus diaphanus] [Rhizophagus sp. MUCL 43196]
MTLKSPRNLNYVTSINFNRAIHKRRRRRIVNRKYRNAFNINTLSRLPLQITNDPFAFSRFELSSAINNWKSLNKLNIAPTPAGLKSQN